MGRPDDFLDQMRACVDGWMNGWIDGYMDEWIDGWMDR
jgi:hypothetical protein